MELVFAFPDLQSKAKNVYYVVLFSMIVLTAQIRSAKSVM
jgi:hypothetical protein